MPKAERLLVVLACFVSFTAEMGRAQPRTPDVRSPHEGFSLLAGPLPALVPLRKETTHGPTNSARSIPPTRV